jgi:ribosomal protein L11 methylase PrmA
MLLSRRAAMLGGIAAVKALAQKAPADQYPDAAPYVPAPPEIAEAMLKVAGVGPGDVVYDLGSGDGRIVIMAAQKFGATAVGVEIDADLVRESREHAQRAGVAGKVTFVEEDLFKTDIRRATVVTVYLLPKTLERLKPKLFAELKPGARVVSFAFPISGWTPSKLEEVNSRRVYMWVMSKDSK